MKKNLLKKHFVLSFVILAFNLSVLGQVQLVENFDYPTGDQLILHNWIVQTPPNTTNPILVGSENLTYTGYPMNKGMSAIMMNTGVDIFRGFTKMSSGYLYMGVLVKVTAVQTGDYFISFKESATSETNTNYRGRIYVRKDAVDASKINFGLAKGSGTQTYTTTQYDINTTYLLVMKYTFVGAIGTDDLVDLYINPVIGATEPASPSLSAADVTQTDYGLGSVLIRQGGSTSGASLVVDGIRVATTWTDVISDLTAPSPVFNPANSATDVLTSVIPTITFDEELYKTDGSPVTNSDLSTLVSFKKTNESGLAVPFTAVIDATRKVITVTPTSPLVNSQAYYLSVSPVKDAIGNESTLKSATFTTIALVAPTITVTYPNGGERMYSGDLKTITWTTTNFDVAENVKIEVWAVDGETGLYEWIILDASTPNDGSLDVTVGPDAPYGTEYVIRISGVTNGATDVSNAPFTVIATASNLLKLRSNRENSIVKYTGTATVTYSRTANNQKYIQDATAAILIHDPTGFITGTYNIGDGIKNIEGTITYYNGLIELVPLAATGETAAGTAIVPEVRTVSSLTSADQCKLVKIEKLQFANPTQYDAGGLFISLRNYDMTGFTPASFTYRTAFGEADYIGQPVPAQYFNAVVLVGQFNTQMQITARNNADITLLSGAKAITGFGFTSPSATGTVDETGKTVTIAVPSGTNVTALVPTISVSAKASVSPASGAAQNFTAPVNYTVTAEDGTTQVYIVTVTVLTGIEKGNDRNIVMYPVPAVSVLNVKNIINVSTVEIMDVTGKVVLRIDDINQNELRIPVSNLRKGMYFLKMTTPEGKIVRRFVKS